MQTVQLALDDPTLAASVRDGLARSGPWQVFSVRAPDPQQGGVVVLDMDSFSRLPLPLLHPERVVLIAQKDPELLARAWEAGIVSVVFKDDAPSTVMLAIMAAALRAARSCVRGISPTKPVPVAPISPSRRPKTH
jgi:hypothetical protein